MPTATGCATRAEGSALSRTQKIPPFQKAVALPHLIQRLARDGVVGIKGCWFWSSTGTNMCDKPLSGEYIPCAADHRSGAGLGRRPVRSVGCHAQVIQLPSSARSSSLDKLVSQLPLLVPRWRVGSLHRPRHSMPGCLTYPQVTLRQRMNPCGYFRLPAARFYSFSSSNIRQWWRLKPSCASPPPSHLIFLLPGQIAQIGPDRVYNYS